MGRMIDILRNAERRPEAQGVKAPDHESPAVGTELAEGIGAERIFRSSTKTIRRFHSSKWAQAASRCNDCSHRLLPSHRLSRSPR